MNVNIRDQFRVPEAYFYQDSSVFSVLLSVLVNPAIGEHYKKVLVLLSIPCGLTSLDVG